MADAPEWMSLELAHHFLKLAIAAYAWPFVMYRYPFSGLTKLAANMTCCSCLRWVSPGTSMLMLERIVHWVCTGLLMQWEVVLLQNTYFSKSFFAVVHMAPYCCWVIQDSIPSVVTRLGTGRFGVRFPVGARGFSLSKICRPAVGPTQPPTQWVSGTLSLWMNQLVCEVYHPPLASTEVTNEWSCAFAPLICPRSMDKDSFTSFFINCKYISVVCIVLPFCGLWKN
jgi:hypothetical protein